MTEIKLTPPPIVTGDDINKYQTANIPRILRIKYYKWRIEQWREQNGKEAPDEDTLKQWIHDCDAYIEAFTGPRDWGDEHAETMVGYWRVT